jgi:hypothetical protein
MPEQERGLSRLVTPRIQVRHAIEADRPCFVYLFGDEGFMAFSDGVLSPDEADERFDRMIGAMR